MNAPEKTNLEKPGTLIGKRLPHARAIPGSLLKPTRKVAMRSTRWITVMIPQWRGQRERSLFTASS